MDFLRLHLPGLHQALRGALDSLSTFVFYLIGDEVPTAERREAWAAKEMGEVAAARPGRSIEEIEEEGQEALEGLGNRQSKGAGGLRGPGEAGGDQEESSATEQTWSWGEGSSHGSRGERQDTGAWEATKASRCQEPKAPLEARKKSEAGGDSSSQAQEGQECNEQEMNREETLRTWEQGEEEEEEDKEEVRTQEPGQARGVESEWTWHREPEGKATADGQKVARDGREAEQVVKEAVAEKIQEAGAREAGREGDVVAVVRDGQNSKAQGTQEPGAESEDGAALGREEVRTASDRGETRTISGEEAKTTSGGEEVGTASGGEEVGTASSGEEVGTASGGEEVGTASSGEEVGTASGGEEVGTASGGEEVGTASSGEEVGTASGGEEVGTASGGEEVGTASSGEEVGTASSGEEAWTASGGEAAWTASGGEEAGTASGGEEAGTTSGEEEAGTTSGEEADLPGVGETEYGAVPGDRTPEGSRRAWALEEASKGAQEEEVDENREAEVRLFPKQTQTLQTEGVEEAAENQAAGKEAAEGQGSEREAGEGSEGQADQDGKEAQGRQDAEDMAAQASLEEVVQAQEAEEGKDSCWATEAQQSQDEAVNLAEGDADIEATPEARPEKEFREKNSEEKAQMVGEELGVECCDHEHEVTEGWQPELTGGLLTPIRQPEEGQWGKEELWCSPALSKEETERSPQDSPRDMGYVKPDTVEADAWESQRSRDVERRDTQGQKVGTQEGDGGTAGGQEPTLPEVLGVGREWREAKGGGWEAESQDLGGGHKAEVGTGQSLGDSGARETKDEEVEATVLWEVDRTPERGLEGAALSLQDGEATQASSLAAGIVENKVASDERAAGPGEGPEREAGEAWRGMFGRGWDSEGRGEAGRDEERVEAVEGENGGRQEFGLGSTAEDEVTGRDGQVEAFEDRESEPGGEWAEGEESVMTDRSCGMDDFTLGSQMGRAEGTGATVEVEGLPEGQMLLEKEAGEWEAREQGQGHEGQHRDRSPEGETQMPCDVADVEVTGHQRAEVKEIDLEDLEDIHGQEDQSTSQDPAEAEPGPREEASRTAQGDARGSWSEAPLPGSRLDVSAPRSRVLLSRSASQRRSRPSFLRRLPTPEQQEEPVRPPPEGEPSALEQRLPQPEESPESGPLRPEGTPMPSRRRPLGHGFGLAHSGMMQELQARLSQPKPQ